MNDDKLREIVRLIKKLSTAGYQKPAEKFQVYEDALLSGKSDTEICEAVYGNKRKGNKFRTLKHRYEAQVYNDLFNELSTLPDDYAGNYKSMAAFKSFTTAQPLFKYGLRSQGISMLEANIDFYVKYGFLELTLMTVRILLDHYSYISIDDKKIDYYQQIHDKTLPIYLDELRVKEINRVFSRKYVESKGALDAATMQELKGLMEDLEKIHARSSSPVIHLFATDLIHFYYAKAGNHKKAVELSRGNLEKTLKEYPDDIKTQYRTMINIALSLHKLSKTEESIDEFQEALKIPTKGTRMWFHDTSLYFLVLLRAERYKETFEMFNDVVKQKNLRLFQDHAEQWVIREAYLNLLLKLEVIPMEKIGDAKLRRFSLGNFLNSVPFYSKDKTGQNISVLIFKYFYYLYKNKFGEIYELSEGLYQYNYNYLNTPEHRRSFLFIKLLIIANKYQHNPALIVDKARKTLTELKELNFVLSEDDISVEIVPYEVLWDILIKQLKAKF